MNAAGEALIPILKKNDMYSHKIYYDHKNTDQYVEGEGFWFLVDGALKTVYIKNCVIVDIHQYAFL